MHENIQNARENMFSVLMVGLATYISTTDNVGRRVYVISLVVEEADMSLSSSLVEHILCLSRIHIEVR